MTAHEYLDQIHELDMQILRKQEKVLKLKESLDVGGISYESIGDAKPHNTGDAMGEAIAKVLDYVEEIKSDTARLVILRIEADKAIQSLTDEKQRYVLEQYYLFYESLEQIAENMKVCRRTAYNYYNAGLENIVISTLCTDLH